VELARLKLENARLKRQVQHLENTVKEAQQGAY
jgi:hypothetical protein